MEELEAKVVAAEQLAATHKAESEAKDQQLKDALKVIEDLKAKLAAASDSAQSGSGDVVVSVSKDKYKIVFPRVTVDGVEYTAQELAKASDVCATLVKNGSGALLKTEK